MNLVLVTGNEKKARQYEEILGKPLEAIALELDEIQSLDLRAILEHKALQAYEIVKRPLFVDDVSLEIEGLRGLPGPFVRWFLETVGQEGVCRMVDRSSTRRATARVGLGYIDQDGFQSCIAEAGGVIAEHPRGEGGFGWDSIFVQDGWSVTRAELSTDEYERVSIRKTALESLKTFLRDRV